MSKTKKTKIEEVLEQPAQELSAEEVKPIYAEPIATEQVVSDEVKELPKTVYRKELDPELSSEVRILSFLEGKKGAVKLNDFLKTLWPLTIGNMPPSWSDQGNMKWLRSVLDKMILEGKLKLTDDSYKLLGGFYYRGDPPRQFHRNLGDVVIEAVTG